jgi:uncharacterized protein (TIGR03435 family)
MRCSVLLVAVAALGRAAAPSFDVASLKPVQITVGDLYTANLGTARHGQVALTNATLSDCIRYAFGITNDAQIAGPDWIRSKEIRFDIAAKSAPETPLDQLLVMLQTLLTERFKLVFHREPRELSYLALTVGKNRARLEAGKEVQGALKPQILGRIISPQMSMGKLAMLLSRFTRQTVIDQTGLQGSFDVNLVWTPEKLNASAEASEAAGPTIYTALQEQLGLKLESHKGPVEVLVIDHAEKVPLEN